jgi:hypothetical protein
MMVDKYENRNAMKKKKKKKRKKTPFVKINNRSEAVIISGCRRLQLMADRCSVLLYHSNCNSFGIKACRGKKIMQATYLYLPNT